MGGGALGAAADARLAAQSAPASPAVRRPDGSTLHVHGMSLMQLRSVLRLLERTIVSASAAEWMVPAPASMAPGGGRLGGGGPPPSRREMERDVEVVKAVIKSRMAAGETL